MATRKSTRSGDDSPPRRGNEIRTHPLSQEDVARWKRSYEKFRIKARKPFALDTALTNLAHEYLVIGVYLSDETAFKSHTARRARKSLVSACDNVLSATHLLSAFIRQTGVPTSPHSMLRRNPT
jgi:hypothetical protein